MKIARRQEQPKSAVPSAWSVRAHLLALVLVATTTVLAGSAYAYAWSWDRAQDDAVDRMSFQSQRAAAAIVDGIATASRTVAALAAQPGVPAAFASSQPCTLTAQGSGAFPDIRLDVVRADGVVACTSGQSPPRDLAVHADAGWLAQTLSSGGAPVVSDDSFDDVTDERAVAVTAPVFSPDSTTEVIGAVVMFLHQEPAAAAMISEFGSSPDVHFTLLDREDREVLSSSESLDPRHLSSPFRTSAGTGTLTTEDGRRLIFGSADVADSDWRVIAALPHDEVFGEARGALLRQVAVGGLALVVLMGGAWLLNRRIARPLQDVTRAAEQASRNPSAPRVREAGTAETAALGRAFNAMLDVRAGHEAQLAYQATHDTLTGLPNKSLLVLHLDRALAEDRSVAVIALGVNRFRNINDAVGHQAGDGLLQEISDRLSSSLRQGDTLARFDSNQFVMLCENVAADQTLSIVQRTQAALEPPFPGPLGDISINLTAGIATGSGASSSSNRLLREADTALHEARSGGRVSHVYDPSMRNRATEHLTLERDLASAVENDQLVVHYQPLVHLATGTVVGAEALVRWHHPERGLIPPIDFIPLAEQTGQIDAIGEFVLHRACEQAVRWAVAGHSLTVSVNVAAGQLRSGQFPHTVRRALAATGLSPQQLCLEITESSLMTGSSQLDDDLAELRQLGVHLALDDFGTGYSSLAYLQQLPCDELKIDRSFVSRLDHDNRELHLVTAIVTMAHALGLTVVAEGIETPQQRRLLADLGCQQGQGYLFSRPVVAAEFDLLLTAAPPWSRRAVRIP